MNKKINVDSIKSSVKFCHYTTIENARKILSGECIFLNKLSNMNDIGEFKLHSRDKDKVFVLSLCNSDMKSIPLFYLYGGIDGKGCKIDFTDSFVRRMITNCKIKPVNKQMQVLKKEYNENDYDIHFGHIYYIAYSGHMRHGKSICTEYKSFDAAYHSLKTYDKYLVKNSIWYHEKEFRIIVIFNKPVKYDRVALSLDIKQREKGITLICGPETAKEDYISIKREFSDYGISKVECVSDMQIKMGLVDKNRYLYHNK